MRHQRLINDIVSSYFPPLLLPCNQFVGGKAKAGLTCGARLVSTSSPSSPAFPASSLASTCPYLFFLESFAEFDCLSVLAAADETRSDLQIAGDITDRQATGEMET